MLDFFRKKIETAIESEVSQDELLCAIQAAKDDITFNNLLFGKDVSSTYFEEKVCDSIRILRKAG